MKAWRWLGCAALICALHACSDDDGGGDDDAGALVPNHDAGPKDDDDAGLVTKPPKHHDAGADKQDSSVKDAEPDAPFDPFGYDANGIFEHDASAPPVPKAWTCPKALWADGYCDCGCSATDVDCTQFSCSQPGCVADSCEACFGVNGAWKPCAAAPSADDWTCDPTLKSNEICDCGCGIPDPECLGSGCSTPGCRKAACDTRHGCGEFVTDDRDDCSRVGEPIQNGAWTCAWDHYGSGDGCDCGCGALDPDCADKLSCTDARCFAAQCDRCSDGDGRPYSCDAAQQGWDDETIDATQVKEASQCNSVHFNADDGCDCGCGGRDPDCGDDGCDEFGCSDSACDRCTDSGGHPTGCAPTEWTTAGCNPDHYGTGDGCDCGCAVPDPDCLHGNTVDGCTTAGCGTDEDSCDSCWNGSTAIICAGWTCAEDAFADTNGTCDCGCGKPDADCREQNRAGCTKEGCETQACERCSDGNELAACGGQWSASYPIKYYGLDGLCDCGAGAKDPDCGKNEGCSASGCNAPGCEVCVAGNLPAACLDWTCDPKKLGSDDGCDCGCGAPDPDCEGQGCQEPGCQADACKACHDPFGRTVKCP